MGHDNYSLIVLDISIPSSMSRIQLRVASHTIELTFRAAMANEHSSTASFTRGSDDETGCPRPLTLLAPPPVPVLLGNMFVNIPVTPDKTEAGVTSAAAAKGTIGAEGWYLLCCEGGWYACVGGGGLYVGGSKGCGDDDEYGGTCP
jgi:hypothetical protein